MSGSTDTVTQKNEPPDWAVPYFKNYLQQGSNVAAQPYQAYSGSRVADFNPTQYAGMDAAYNRAMQGTPEQSAGRAELTKTASGGYLGNSASTNANLGATNQQANAYNPNAGVRNESANVTNPYAGDNKYLQQMIDSASGDVRRNYDQSVRPQLDSLKAQSGSFGNANLQSVDAESQRQLAGELGRVTSGLRFNDYTTQQGLAENAANRKFQAGEGLAQRLFGAGQQQSQNQYASGESLANRRFSGGESQAGRNQAGYEAERGRMMGSLSMVPQFANMDYTDINALLGVGDAQQQQQQRYLDDDYGRFTEARDYPLKQLDIVGRMLGGANYGQTSQQQQPGTSGAATAAGGALAASAMSGWGK